MDHQIICDICGKSFSKKFASNRHKQLHNNETYSCATCAKVFETKQYLEMHVLTHNPTKSFECDKCKQQFGIYTSRGGNGWLVFFLHFSGKGIIFFTTRGPFYKPQTTP